MNKNLFPLSYFFFFVVLTNFFFFLFLFLVDGRVFVVDVTTSKLGLSPPASPPALVAPPSSPVGPSGATKEGVSVPKLRRVKSLKGHVVCGVALTQSQFVTLTSRKFFFFLKRNFFFFLPENYN